jgi:hypothetical protein
MAGESAVMAAAATAAPEVRRRGVEASPLKACRGVP